MWAVIGNGTESTIRLAGKTALGALPPSVIGWIVQSLEIGLGAGTLRHFPACVQQSWVPVACNMKKCEHDRQPPHSRFATSNTASAEPATVLSTVILPG